MLARQLQTQARALQVAAVAVAPGPLRLAARCFGVSSGDTEYDEEMDVPKEEAVDEPESVKQFLHAVPKYNPPIKTGMKGISIVRGRADVIGM